jgi:hypothetical protein
VEMLLLAGVAMRHLKDPSLLQLRRYTVQ